MENSLLPIFDKIPCTVVLSLYYSTEIQWLVDTRCNFYELLNTLNVLSMVYHTIVFIVLVI